MSLHARQSCTSNSPLPQPKYNKNAKKKEKKKAKKLAAGEKKGGDDEMKDAAPAATAAAAPPGVEIEYVADSMVDSSDPLYEEWSKIFNHFQKSKDEKEEAAEGKEGEDVTVKKSAPVKADEDDEDEDGEGKSKEKLSRKKFKLLNRLSIAELKQLVKRPDVVEVWDVTSSDPRLLVFLKSYRNTVPVPRHWCNKRKYLQGKRGIEKLPFQLPSFIEATGIAKLRQAYEDKNAEQSAKQKARNQSRPKMSKMDIDYQVSEPSFPLSPPDNHKPVQQNPRVPCTKCSPPHLKSCDIFVVLGSDVFHRLPGVARRILQVSDQALPDQARRLVL